LEIIRFLKPIVIQPISMAIGLFYSLRLQSLKAQASRLQIGAADPTEYLNFIFHCVFESRNYEKKRILRNFWITEITVSWGFHGKIFLTARFLASTVILFFFSCFSFSIRGFVIQSALESCAMLSRHLP